MEMQSSRETGMERVSSGMDSFRDPLKKNHARTSVISSALQRKPLIDLKDGFSVKIVIGTTLDSVTKSSIRQSFTSGN